MKNKTVLMMSALLAFGLLATSIASINFKSSQVVCAEVEGYGIYIGDDEVTEEKLNGEGWAYTPATSETNAILTLNGVNISSGYESYSGQCGIYYEGSDPLDIVLEENSVNTFITSELGFSGMDLGNADVSISGKGKIVIEAQSYGIKYGNLVVNDATIEISSQLHGIGRNDFTSTLTINNASINILVTVYNPITAGTLNVNNSTIVALATSGSREALVFNTLSLSKGMFIMAGDNADTATIVEDASTWDHSGKWVKIALKPTDKTTLNATIEEVEEYYNSIKENNEYGSFSTELFTAINSAKEVANDDDATQDEVDDAKIALDNAADKVQADIKEYEDTKVAKVAIDKINVLPNASDVTADDKESIEAARAAYDALTEDQKEKVTSETLKKLTDAEDALANLKPVDPQDPQKQGGLSGGAIAGIVIGSIFFLLLIACLVLYLLNKKEIINISFLNKNKKK